MIPYTLDWRNKLNTARRVFSLIPILVFLFSLMLFAQPVGGSATQFAQILLHVVAASLASCFICTAAYGFYRYLLERSPGL